MSWRDDITAPLELGQNRSKIVEPGSIEKVRDGLGYIHPNLHRRISDQPALHIKDDISTDKLIIRIYKELWKSQLSLMDTISFSITAANKNTCSILGLRIFNDKYEYDIDSIALVNNQPVIVTIPTSDLYSSKAKLLNSDMIIEMFALSTGKLDIYISNIFGYKLNDLSDDKFSEDTFEPHTLYDWRTANNYICSGYVMCESKCQVGIYGRDSYRTVETFTHNEGSEYSEIP